MKISKLFHWLYAILMFLPILVFIPNAFYYGFNETAIAQEKTEQVPVYYDTNEVNTIDDLVDGNVYRFYFRSISNSSGEVVLAYNFLYFSSVYTDQPGAGVTQPIPYIRKDSSVTYFINYLSTTDKRLVNSFGGFCDIVYKTSPLLNELVSLIDICPIQYVKEVYTNTYDMSITDSMSYAWKSTWQNELFSWSYDSFLTHPFLYITNLFNVPASNTLLYCLSYWLNISIIWLCFDVVMYVPLLVHRWLDKGIVE